MSARIHPTAMVGSQVELAEDVYIGPYCLLEGSIKIESGTVLLGHVCTQGPMTIGRNNRIYPHTTLGYDPQDLAFNPDKSGVGCVIGNSNIIREGVSIHRATQDSPTRIGHGNMLMAHSHVAHDCVLENDVVMANSALLGGHCYVEDGAFLGGNCGIHQFCRIGRLAMVSAEQGVSQDVAPFCMVLETRTVTGLNRVGLRRAGMRDAIKPLEKAYEILLRANESNHNAIARVRRELGDCSACLEMAAFVEASRRGITRHFNRKHVMMRSNDPLIA